VDRDAGTEPADKNSEERDNEDERKIVTSRARSLDPVNKCKPQKVHCVVSFLCISYIVVITLDLRP